MAKIGEKERALRAMRENDDDLPFPQRRTEPEPSVEMAIPDPRRAPIPVGWATDTFAALADHLEWDDLRDAEAKLNGLASHIDSLRGDKTELEKALRIVEFRKAVLLGEPRQGARTDREPFPRVEEVDAAPATVSRWREIARHWDRTVWPHLLAAKEARDVSQAAVLRLIEAEKKKAVKVVAPQNSVKNGPPPVDPESDAEEDAGFGEVDAVAEWEKAEAEVTRLSEQVEALSASDLGSEVRRWQVRCEQLEGRLRHETNRANQAEKSARWATGLLREIAKAVGVDDFGEIVKAIGSRK